MANELRSLIDQAPDEVGMVASLEQGNI